jgi:hypothetical protein
MAIPETSEENNLAGHADLRQDVSGGPLPAAFNKSTVWNLEIMEGFGGRWCAWPQLAMVQVNTLTANRSTNGLTKNIQAGREAISRPIRSHERYLWS